MEPLYSHAGRAGDGKDDEEEAAAAYVPPQPSDKPRSVRACVHAYMRTCVHACAVDGLNQKLTRCMGHTHTVNMWQVRDAAGARG